MIDDNLIIVVVRGSNLIRDVAIKMLSILNDYECSNHIICGHFSPEAIEYFKRNRFYSLSSSHKHTVLLSYQFQNFKIKKHDTIPLGLDNENGIMFATADLPINYRETYYSRKNYDLAEYDVMGEILCQDWSDLENLTAAEAVTLLANMLKDVAKENVPTKTETPNILCNYANDKMRRLCMELGYRNRSESLRNQRGKYFGKFGDA